MSISSATSSASVAAYQRPQGPGREIREGIDQLKSAVESGDIAAAKEAYSSLSKLQESSGRKTDGKDPLSTLLSNVGSALESGDITQVQQAFAQSGPPDGAKGGPQAAGGGQPPGPPPGGGGPSQEVRDAIGGLADALRSGDVSSAQDAYSSLASLLEEEAEDEETDETTTESTDSDSPADRFKAMLEKVGSALESGDLSGAQTLFAAMTPRGSQGVDLHA
ncbi:hypothetical protein HL658_16185 [Azospirillum sp. RWY-5-1]|uniref:Uncharacterized protein n=1 Tax=Azospirillum oleiclasticum TaxID=2735135 RepID=A0ABX2TBM5_9PROT|nr:hypothetical protein [Azospirillum oleiclasticum]NYZ14095.1 hypothetical protein [Azospirillum oleiclasticum]NYZ21579.1 hypothetical protein [Azospirillum oleiclasticum]